MDCTSTRLPYRQTGAFEKIVLDYIDGSEALKPFYSFHPSLQGIQKAMVARDQFPQDRKTLVNELQKQYKEIDTSKEVTKNIVALGKKNSYTITTAHQTNLFTGPLYFIYKIIHCIKLAAHLNETLPGNHFIPVFYAGTEDADLDELNHIFLFGEKLDWKTKQSGAVGRMKIDKELQKLVTAIEAQLGVQPFGKEIIQHINECYQQGTDIQAATFRFVNALFGEYGLVVLLPDNPVLKSKMTNVFEDDLLNQSAATFVGKSVKDLGDNGYKIQASPREINLFYLKDDLRERIGIRGSKYEVLNSKISFSREELLKELKDHPEWFSPNVILRGLYQETILPNIAFIGGGGELAYWLELNPLFEHYKIPFPVLVLRNSFLLIEKKWKDMISRLGFTPEDIFLPEQELLNRLVIRESKKSIALNGTYSETEQLYSAIKQQAAAIDSTLLKHVEALRLNTLKRLQELEKKMLRAEKRKFTDQQRQIHTIKEHLFPGNGLQERKDNLLYYYAKWGKDFIKNLYKHSLTLEQEFVIISEGQ